MEKTTTIAGLLKALEIDITQVDTVEKTDNQLTVTYLDGHNVTFNTETLAIVKE